MKNMFKKLSMVLVAIVIVVVVYGVVKVNTGDRITSQEVDVVDDTQNIIQDGGEGDGDEVIPGYFDLRAALRKQNLYKTTWIWVNTTYINDGENAEDVITPSDSTQFIATFTEQGLFSSTTDCNNMSGAYSANGSGMSIGPLAMTKMACSGEIFEDEYAQALDLVVEYELNDGGTLTLNLADGSGYMTFEPYQEIIHDSNTPSLSTDITVDIQ